MTDNTLLRIISIQVLLILIGGAYCAYKLGLL
jgi:hypothetical protein